jgi:glycine oxidase
MEAVIPSAGATGSPNVIVVGGGVIGLGVAWRASQAGLSVIVVDPGDAGGASAVAAGMLAPVTEAHYGEETLLQLNLASSQRYPGFVAEIEEATGMDCGYSQCGTLSVARDADDNTALDDLYAFQQRLDLKVERLRARECREIEPNLSPRVRGGILVEDDHQVDPPALVAALSQACAGSGVQRIRDRVRSVEASGDAIRGVTLEGGGRVVTGNVVVAAGCWSGSIEGLPRQAQVAIRPVKGQLLQLRSRGGGSLAHRNVRGLDVYIVSRPDGRTVLGATVEEQGFDTTTTAGAAFELLRDAWELLPGIREMELVSQEAGLRPGTPDNAPLIGTTSIEGLLMATGHYRNGILLAPITAELVTGMLAGQPSPELAERYSPRRLGL